jgi:two-component system cell cycle sensor histidine kinase/response regulator CckA
MESVERVVAGMTHEFNNLLTAIMGHAELLVEDLPPRTDVSASARVIRREAERARQLTQRLLGLSRHRQFVPVPLSCNLLVRELVTLMRPSMGERITLSSRLTDENDSVRGDMGLLQQVLVNLCLNARDAIAGEGQITIDTSVREVTGPECRFQQDRTPGTYVEICVRDTGAGMTPEIIDRVFEPFFTTKEAGAGSGLGMSVVHGIVRNHGGHVDIESAPGEGTNVYVRLPQIEGSTVHTERDEEVFATSDHLRGTESILLIDDERNIVMYGRRVLTRLGYHVYHATSADLAREAIARYQRELALIILDMSMPDTSGQELLAEIRQCDREIPIIVATGFAPGGLDDELVEQVQGFIKKPYTPQDLAEQVREVIDEARGG